ncbi:MAG: hypothetical protein GX794_01020 [Acholeplasmataceae bacterium]|jgi:hypothetical protein|nr:hypothetical protein [Acholeplasmataceae bacterium]
MSIRGFALANGYNRETLRDWVNAYKHLEGGFIRIDNINEDESIIGEKDIRMNLLKPDQIIKKSTHFSRFDHSVVVIEAKNIKITTSLSQALEILEKIYDRL